MDLSETFRDRRLALALTQEEAAQRARLTRKTVSDFENGRRSISVTNLSRLLGAVGLDLVIRDARLRPNLDELPDRYPWPEAPPRPPRRARRGPR